MFTGGLYLYQTLQALLGSGQVKNEIASLDHSLAHGFACLSFAQSKCMRQHFVTARSHACARTHERPRLCLRFSMLLHCSVHCLPTVRRDDR